MPSSDRSEPRAADPAPETRGLGLSSQSPRSKPPAQDGDVQFFDPSEPWDAQAAEALTSLYEETADELWRRQDTDRAQRRAAPERTAPNLSEPSAEWISGIEKRIAGLIQTMQESLAGAKPDQAALDPLHRRIDAIEQRLGEALKGVARRTDVEGLHLIETQVAELAAHVEQASSGLQRIDGLDGQLRELSRKLDEDSLQRLDALERTLQNYVAEWRRSDERTGGALEVLDETLTRIGASIDAADALKPAPSLSLADLPTGGDAATHDPLAHIYAEGARALSPRYQLSLDAADYAPGAPVRVAEPAAKPDPVADLPAEAGDKPAEKLPQPARLETPLLTEPGDESHAPSDTAPTGSELAPPAFRASAIRARLQKQQMLDAETATSEAHPRPAKLLAKEKAKASGDANRARPSVLLAAGVTLFAAAGYLLVDVFLSPAPQAPRHGEAPVESRGDKSTHATPDAELKQAGRVEAIGTAIAAVFREPSERPTPAVHNEAPTTAAEPLASSLMVPPAATIGPASLRQAAMNGDATAQYEIGIRYAAGRGVAQNMDLAFQWHARAAARGLAPAQFRLAAMYERGQGTVADTEKARSWYRSAAEQGHVKAMHNLAVLSVGGGRSDYPLATKWFTEAAERGLADSQFNLAVLYQNGLGVAKDLKQAYKWLSLAARGGDAEAAARVASIKSQLSPADARAADAAIATWRVRSPDPRAAEPASSGLVERP